MRIKFVKAMTYIAWVVLVVSAMAMDSANILYPICGLVASLCWLTLVMLANSIDLDKDKKKKRQPHKSDTSLKIKSYKYKTQSLYQTEAEKAIIIEEFKNRFKEHDA